MKTIYTIEKFFFMRDRTTFRMHFEEGELLDECMRTGGIDSQDMWEYDTEEEARAAFEEMRKYADVTVWDSYWGRGYKTLCVTAFVLEETTLDDDEVFDQAEWLDVACPAWSNEEDDEDEEEEN